MKKYSPSKFDIRHSLFCGSTSIRGKLGFTLIEVILVVVISLILLGVAMPHFARTYKGSKLRSAARTVNRMARFARNSAIMRETTMTVVLNHETMEIYLGSATQTSTNAADGELDQDVLKRLGYVDDESSPDTIGIEKEIHRFLPEDIEVADFEKDMFEEDEAYEDLYLFRFYPDGQSDWFILKLKGRRGLGIKLENDPISGKIRSEFTQ
jgi:prepilin-type N-terminal cleavage/methylation domain-containing protein